MKMNRIKFEMALAAAAVFPSVYASVASAAEGPTFDVTVNNTVTVYTATPASSSTPGFKPHINFPYMKNYGNNDLVLQATVGQTQSGTQFGVSFSSSDGGATWNPYSPVSVPFSQYIAPISQTSYGIRQQLDNVSGSTQWNGTLYTSVNSGIGWNFSTASFNSDVAYTSSYSSFSDIINDNGTLLTSAQGTRLGSNTSEYLMFASTDGGNTWNRRSTIASYSSSLNYGSMGSEGPSEGSVVKLDNGNLLAVYRTGQPFPDANSINAVTPALFWSMSADGGHNWTVPKTLGVEGVMPLMRKLDDGSVALSYGRYGGNIMFADPTGQRWSYPTNIYNGPGSGHVELRQTGNGTYAYAYDQSSFYPPSWDGSVPQEYVYDNDQSANLKVAQLSIQQQPVTDQYQWALQYHGDVTPDSLASPWIATLENWAASGSSVRLSADRGQDFMELDTYGHGRLIYSQDGTDTSTPWSMMDFQQGVVIETRNRLTRNDAGDVATLSLGDGQNGGISLTISSAGVSLHGANTSSYLAAEHPGFSVIDWHDYLLVLKPGALGGGNILAQLYLDGESQMPIISQYLDTGIVINGIGIGDFSGTNGFTWDVDYLRFASVPEPAALFLLIPTIIFLRRREDEKRQRRF
jgi:hypothetical protein